MNAVLDESGGKTAVKINLDEYVAQVPTPTSRTTKVSSIRKKKYTQPQFSRVDALLRKSIDICEVDDEYADFVACVLASAVGAKCVELDEIIASENEFNAVMNKYLYCVYSSTKCYILFADKPIHVCCDLVSQQTKEAAE